MEENRDPYVVLKNGEKQYSPAGSEEPVMYQWWRAPNDRNGNPRRLFVLINNRGIIVGYIDEGYIGHRRWLHSLVQLPTVYITATEYRTIRNNVRDFEKEA